MSKKLDSKFIEEDTNKADASDLTAHTDDTSGHGVDAVASDLTAHTDDTSAHNIQAHIDNTSAHGISPGLGQPSFAVDTSSDSRSEAFAHGLGVIPQLVQVTLVATAAFGGYSIGDELGFNNKSATGFSRPWAADDTSIWLLIEDVSYSHKTSGLALSTSLQNLYFSVKIRAWI